MPFNQKKSHKRNLKRFKLSKKKKYNKNDESESNSNLTVSKAPFYCYHWSKLLVDELVKIGWRLIPFKQDETYDYSDCSKNSKVKNKIFERSFLLTNKFYMYNNLKNKYYIPTTYPIIDGKWLERVPSEEGIFFVKNAIQDANRDNILLNNVTDIENLSSKNKKIVYVVQPALKNLLLYNKKKFDIRIMVTIVSRNHFDYDFFIFKKGYMRTTFSDFDENSLDQEIQMTNFCVQEKKGITISDEFIFDSRKENYELLFQKIIMVCQDIYDSIVYQFVTTSNFMNKLVFNVGFDFIFDTNFNIYLLETNLDPGINTCPNDFYKILAKNIYTPLAKNQPIIIDKNNFVKINTNRN